MGEAIKYGNRKSKTGDGFIKKGVVNMSDVAEKSNNRGELYHLSHFIPVTPGSSHQLKTCPASSHM